MPPQACDKRLFRCAMGCGRMTYLFHWAGIRAADIRFLDGFILQFRPSVSPLLKLAAKELRVPYV